MVLLLLLLVLNDYIVSYWGKAKKTGTSVRTGVSDAFCRKHNKSPFSIELPAMYLLNQTQK